jgi:hypothetical protein
MKLPGFVSREEKNSRLDDVEICVIATRLDYERVLSSDSKVEVEALRSDWESKALLDRIGAAIEVRKIIAASMPVEELKRYVSHLQVRYRAAGGEDNYQRYIAGAPKNLEASEPELRAEVRTLLERLRLAYSVVHFRNCYLRSIRWRFLAALLIELILLVAILTTGRQFQSISLANFGLVALVGILGSTVSILRRSQSIATAETFTDDPMVQVSALRFGRWGIYAAVFSGPVFAIVLALVFMGGIINVDGLTPVFCTHYTATDCPGPREQFWVLQRAFTLKTNIDAAKLLVLCFLSGFAEQLVPDVLDRFAQTVAKK